MSIDTLMRDYQGILHVSIDTRFLDQRKIFIEGEITPESACDFVKKVLFLCSENEDLPIDVFINSTGGEVNSGLLIYDTIQSCRTPIRMFCIGRAYSMAALLFASGNNGRYITPNGELMIHEPLVMNQVSGSSSSIKSVSDSLLESKFKLDSILAKHCGKSMEEVEEATSYDHYLSPDESIKFGLCDRVIDDFDMLKGGNKIG